MLSFNIINPADGNTVGVYPHTTLDDSLNALEKLNTEGLVFQNKLTSFERSQILLNLSDLLKSNKEKLAIKITEETGKVICESRAEVERAILTSRIASEEAKRIVGESRLTNSFNLGEQKISITQRRPYGVVMCITPFNFPLNLALHKIAPAFASGNTILFKPSDHAFGVAKKLVELCYDAGISESALQLICPDIESLNSIVRDDRIKVISFTGGTKTANKIASLAGRKKLLLELGGNDAMAIFPNTDLNKAAREAVNGRFGTCGQKCIANKRVFIHEDCYDEFKAYLLEYASDFNYNFPDNPLSESAKLGPLITEEMAKKVEFLVERAKSNGANILLGGKRHNAFFEATILENVLDSEEILREETFGPVLGLSKFSQEEELIQRINQSPYGLQAGVYTNNIEQAKRLFDKVEVGTLYINNGPANRDEFLPFGGVKDSGFGREGVKYAMEEMSFIKQLII